MEDKEEKEKEPNAKGGGMSKLLIIGAVVVLVAAIAAGAVWYFFFSATDHAGEEAAKTPKTPGVVFDVGEFKTNLADPGGKRYLVTKVAIELNEEKKDEKKMAALKEQTPLIRDRILMILSAKTVEDLQTPEAREKVKKEILVSLNKYFGPDKFRGVYFSDFIYQ
ncbi:flagellar basal body-associated FliL family protein [Heliophilum fasciatum]|uniref:Flagellar protein FliL n=1 Tax=Heliophilum fasciatum TaxID=35700 RepID=A0A4V2SX35_9FIRM|nr:flagellar basal body-associated FliL family protein [Heliophilum fasciatum]MCW2277934.1 flagellar FliL protein [Heliophilum fasciatum]TCP64496.1 flagellar FliL protein [Heliophilum fasciatum]